MGAFSKRTPASPRFFSFKKNFVFYVNALYFIMGKRTKRCPKKCEKHKFILKPIHYTAVFSRELEADYCSVNKKHPSIIPTFNNDKKHFTIGFFLPTDNVLEDITQEKLLANELLYKQEHEKYKKENTDEKT